MHMFADAPLVMTVTCGWCCLFNVVFKNWIWWCLYCYNSKRWLYFTP